MEKCPVCRMPAMLDARDLAGFTLRCCQCGNFHITIEADFILKASPIDPLRIGATSNYIRKNANLTIAKSDLDSLRQVRVPPVAEKATNLLIGFATQHTQPGYSFPDPVPRIRATINKLAPYESQSTYPASAIPDYATFLSWLAVAAANDWRELHWLIQNFLAGQA